MTARDIDCSLVTLNNPFDEAESKAYAILCSRSR
jgi:hypothetical protein